MTDGISVIGLGKLGLCLAAVLAKKGFNTIGVDIEESVVEAINNGQSPITEPELPELIAEVGGNNLRATLEHRAAIEKSDVTFILVATPSNPDGSFSNRYIESALKTLATALRQSRKDYHLFVISSTVAPGSVEGSFIPIIEGYSGKKLNKEFGICYDPDFVALGNVINGFLRPELVVIGESSQEAGDIIENIHNRVCENEPHISRMSLISAEIAKISLNTYITFKISFANTLANICENTPGADLDAITSAIGVDRRISPFYLKGGPAYGGTCFPRDTRAFITFAGQQGNEAELIEAVERVNAYQNQHLLDLVSQHLEGGQDHTLGVLGLAFKPNTPVVTESPGIKLIEGLQTKGMDLTIVGYDPLAIESARMRLGESIEYVTSTEECLDRSSVCVITTPDAIYKSVAENFKANHPITVIDCWRLINPSALNENVKYVAWGYAGGTLPGHKVV